MTTAAMVRSPNVSRSNCSRMGHLGRIVGGRSAQATARGPHSQDMLSLDQEGHIEPPPLERSVPTRVPQVAVVHEIRPMGAIRIPRLELRHEMQNALLVFPAVMP